MRTQGAIRLLLMSAALGVTLGQIAVAQDDAIMNTEPIYQGDPINIEGYKKSQVMATDGELEGVKAELQKQKQTLAIDKAKTKGYRDLERTTEKMADAKEQMIDQKIESQKTISQYNKKMKAYEQRLSCLEKNNWDKSKCPKLGERPVLDTVSTQVAGLQKIEAPAPKASSDAFGDEVFKITPFAGGTAFQGEKYDFEATVTTGLRVESKVHERFAIGVGFTYTNMAVTYLQNMYSNFMAPVVGYSPTNYGNYMGREIGYKNFGGDIYGKFILIPNSRFQPYVGLGAGFARTSLKFKDVNAGSGYNQYNMEAPEYVANNAIGEAMVGTDVMFTKNVGMNLEFKYAKSLATTFDDQVAQNNLMTTSGNYTRQHDQYFLQELGTQIDASNMFSVSVGMTVAF